MRRMASFLSKTWCHQRTLTSLGNTYTCIHRHTESYQCVCSSHCVCLCSCLLSGLSLSVSVKGKWGSLAWWWWEMWPLPSQSLWQTRRLFPNYKTLWRTPSSSATALCPRFVSTQTHTHTDTHRHTHTNTFIWTHVHESNASTYSHIEKSQTYTQANPHS